MKLGFPVPIKAWLKEEHGYEQVKALFEADFAKNFDQENHEVAR